MTHKPYQAILQPGFTLLEILVALAIVAISLTALSGSISTVTSNNATIQQKTVALWIAEDVINEHRINHQWPPVGRHTGTRELLGSQWQWSLQIEQTSTQDMFKATVSVANSANPDKVLSWLNTYYSTYIRSQQNFHNG